MNSHGPSIEELHKSGELIHLANLPSAQRQHPNPHETTSEWDQDSMWTSPTSRRRVSSALAFVTRAEQIYGEGSVRMGMALDTETKEVKGVVGEIGIYVDSTAFWALARKIIEEQSQQ